MKKYILPWRKYFSGKILVLQIAIRRYSHWDTLMWMLNLDIFHVQLIKKTKETKATWKPEMMGPSTMTISRRRVLARRNFAVRAERVAVQIISVGNEFFRARFIEAIGHVARAYDRNLLAVSTARCQMPNASHQQVYTRGAANCGNLA